VCAAFSFISTTLFPDWGAELDEAVRVVRPGGRSEIQRGIEYAPTLVFHSGTPDTAPAAGARELSEKVRTHRCCKRG